MFILCVYICVRARARAHTHTHTHTEYNQNKLTKFRAHTNEKKFISIYVHKSTVIEIQLKMFINGKWKIFIIKVIFIYYYLMLFIFNFSNNCSKCLLFDPIHAWTVGSWTVAFLQRFQGEVFANGHKQQKCKDWRSLSLSIGT